MISLGIGQFLAQSIPTEVDLGFFTNLSNKRKHCHKTNDKQARKNRLLKIFWKFRLFILISYFHKEYFRLIVQTRHKLQLLSSNNNNNLIMSVCAITTYLFFSFSKFDLESFSHTVLRVCIFPILHHCIWMNFQISSKKSKKPKQA